jgi:hypothetical protein
MSSVTVIQALGSLLTAGLGSFAAAYLAVKLARRRVLAEKLAEGAVTKLFEFADTRARLRQGLDEWICGPLIRGTWNAQTETIKAFRDLRRISEQFAIASPEFGRDAIDHVKSLEQLIGQLDAGEVLNAAHMLAKIDEEYVAFKTKVGHLTCK